VGDEEVDDDASRFLSGSNCVITFFLWSQSLSLSLSPFFNKISFMGR